MFRSHTLRRMIDTHGKEVTFRSNTAGTYDPSTGGITGGSTTDYTVKAHPSNYNLMESRENSVVDGMRVIVMSTVDTCGDAIPEPEVDDLIIGIGDTVTIDRVQTIFSGSAVCYICRVKE